MVKGKLRNSIITIDAVLDKISEYDVFKYYMPNSDWKLNQVTYSPFRNENHPSFLIGVNSNRLYFIDFTDTSKRGSCFDFVKILFNLSNLSEVLELIDKDFGLGFRNETNTKIYERLITVYEQPKDIIKKYSNIQVVTRNFYQDELDYWNNYGISLNELKENNVYAISKVYINKKLVPINISTLRFGYLYNDNWKIYTPFAKDKKLKWFPNNVPITSTDGLDKLENCDKLLITKSKKDYMVIKKVYPYVCAVQNEGVACFSEENVNIMKSKSNVQILSFDSDLPGVTNSQYITKLFNFDYCNVPKNYLKEGLKDWADLAKSHGLNKVEECLIKKGIL